MIINIVMIYYSGIGCKKSEIHTEQEFLDIMKKEFVLKDWNKGESWPAQLQFKDWVLPDDFISAMDIQTQSQHEKRKALDEIDESIIDYIPTVHPETKIEKRPVLGEGKFEWAMVLTTADREEPIPCSSIVQLVVKGSDGKRTVGEILGWDTKETTS